MRVDEGDSARVQMDEGVNILIMLRFVSHDKHVIWKLTMSSMMLLLAIAVTTSCVTSLNSMTSTNVL